VAVPTDDQTLFDVLSKPRFVMTCLNPKCKKCGHFQQEKTLYIIDADCWKCQAPMKIAVMDYGGHDFPGPDRFSPQELEFARSKGVLIKNNYSKTVRQAYLSNTCPTCDMLTGDHFLFTDYYTQAIYGYYPYESFPQGYRCEHCD
jgi:phage FluMu protein Com